MTSVRLPKNIEEKLQALSELTGKKKSAFIVEALSEYLADLEDYQLAAERMSKYDQTESVSLDVMREIYEVED